MTRMLGEVTEQTLPGQTLRSDARRNHDRLIEAALELFGTVGVSVPIETLAAHAGVGVGTVYRHFPTKDALVEAVICKRMEFLLMTARALKDAEDPGRGFFSFLELVVEEGQAKRDLADALSKDCRNLDAMTAAASELFAAVAELLERAQVAGSVRPDVTIGDVFALLAGTCLAGDSSGARTGSAKRMLAVVCDGLSLRAARG